MDKRTLCEVIGRLLRHPTAPYFEQSVRGEVEAICRENRLDCRRDRFGNVLVRLNTAEKDRACVLAAHMDHPGFELIRRAGPRTWLARFRGGVPDEYFRAGLALRLMPGVTQAKLGRRHGRDRIFEIQGLNTPAIEPTFAVWEVEDFAVRQGRIHGRSCDDLVGVACVLCTLIELKRRRAKVNVIGVLSRAEEVGFHGALAVAGAKELPKDCLIVSLETSRELPGVEMGKGVILRVGDRTSIFDSDAMRFLTEVAGNMHQPGFHFQRALMGGGTCEATAFQEFGFQVAAVCVALGNYHNCSDQKRIAPEYVSVADVNAMVNLLVESARQLRHFSKLIAKLPKRLDLMRLEAEKMLLKST